MSKRVRSRNVEALKCLNRSLMKALKPSPMRNEKSLHHYYSHGIHAKSSINVSLYTHGVLLHWCLSLTFSSLCSIQSWAHATTVATI